MLSFIRQKLWVGLGKAVANQGKSCGGTLDFSTHVVKLDRLGVGKASIYTQFMVSFSRDFSQAVESFFNLLVGTFYTQSTNPITTITIK